MKNCGPAALDFKNMLSERFLHTKRLYYIGLFILFGLLIAFCTSLVNYRLQKSSIKSKVDKQAREVFERKISELEKFVFGLEDIVTSLRDNKVLLRYLRDPSEGNHQTATSLLYAVTNSNSALMQVRYLDVNGLEKIRVDWGFGQEKPSIIPEEELQDKSHRYYFIEASQIPPTSFWHSKLDLNVENRKIQVPYKPVLRVASPIYIDQQFQGIVIINMHAKDFLNRFKRNALFEICLIDQDGYFLSGFDDEVSWSRYLESGYTLQSEYPEHGQDIIYGSRDLEFQQFGRFFAGSVKSFLKKDGGILFLNVRDDAERNMANESRKAALLIITIIFLLSIPLALFISRGPANLHNKIADQNRIQTEYFELIDKNIHTCTFDLKGTFKEVSSALAKTLGVPKDEIIGMRYDKFYCSHLPLEYYNKIWETIRKGDTWSGEVQHSRRTGGYYWSDQGYGTPIS